MGRLRHSVPAALILSLALFSVSCGGSSSSYSPPPPVADFTIGVSSGSVSLSQGSASSPVSISINPLNGFSGTVQITLSAVPSGVTSNPASPFSISAGASTQVIFGAAANSATGNFTISVQGTSGSLSHAASLPVAIQSAVTANLPRSAYARTDATSAADNPFGEPHHRHIAYDPANKHIFVANRAMNRVEVFSSAGPPSIAEISVPGASSADLSADGATVWIGTALERVVALDTSSLRVSNRYLLTGLSPIPGTIFSRPIEVLSLSGGKCMIRLRQSVSAEALLALWDPASNSLAGLTSLAPALFQQGVGVLARSADHSKVIAAANDSSGEIGVFDSTGNLVAGPLSLGSGSIPVVSANNDGGLFAVVFTGNSGAQVLLLNSSLQQVGAYTSSAPHSLTFSRDGNLLYLSEASSGAPVITVLDGHTAQLVGRVPDVAIQGVSSQIEDVDETNMLFALANRGVSFVDAVTPSNLSLSAAPAIAAAPSLQPSVGPLAGGTSVALSGQNFTSITQLRFGTQAAASVSVSGSSQILATSPPSVATGPVNVSAYFQNGWLALAPDAFSYGPQILQILPNAGTSAGGDSVQIYGYGFGSDPTKITVTIGGANAVVQKVENVATVVPSLGLDTTYPFPLERVTFQTPAGSPGKADAVLSAPSGSATASKSFQFLQSVYAFSKAGFFKFLLYDQSRQRVYLTNIDHVDLFDLQQGIFLSPIEPPGGPPPTAGLRGLALTPDASQLVVADFGSQNVYLLDPVTGTGTTVSVGGVPGYTNSGPSRVAATSTQAVFVGMSAEGASSAACSACLAQMNLMVSPPTVQPAPQPEVTSIVGAPLVQSADAGSQVFVAFGSAPGGPVAVWNSNAPNQFQTSAGNASATDLGVSSDGSMFALLSAGSPEIRAADLSLSSIPTAAELQQVPGRVLVPGVALHPSGALIYQPFLTGAAGSPGVKGGVDILDAHSGVLRLRVFLAQQLMTDVDGLHGSFLAVDENGQRLFAITSSDGTPQKAALTVIQLAAVPLGIGTITPSNVSVAGGTSITIRGSGFQSGATVTLNGKSAAVTFKDQNTLVVITPILTAGPQQITITNPDAETVSLDAALTAN